MNNIRFLTYSLLEVSYYFIVRKIGLYQPSVTYLPLALADLGSSGIHTFLWYFPLFSLLFDQLRLWLRKYVPAIGTRNTVFKYSQKSHSILQVDPELNFSNHAIEIKYFNKTECELPLGLWTITFFFSFCAFTWFSVAGLLSDLTISDKKLIYLHKKSKSFIFTLNFGNYVEQKLD